MAVNLLPYLNQIASYLSVPAGKLSCEGMTPVCSKGNASIKGFFNITIDYLATSKSPLAGKTNEDKAEIYQWIEYGIVFAAQAVFAQNTQQVLTELNGVLATRTYLVSHQFSIADVVLYYILLNAMQGISYLEKEKYVNLSRWFDNLQQDTALRQKNKTIDFSTNYLAGLVPARH